MTINIVQLQQSNKYLKQGVPAQYIGLWRRHLLETATSKDDSALVLWMQSQHYHIDLRIPAACTGFSAVKNLHEYNDMELMLLATQQGFAGITTVSPETAQSSSVCQWLREIDYQTPTDAQDIGNMLFIDANTVIETGIDAAYLELWRRQVSAIQPCYFKQVLGKNSIGKQLPAYLIRIGNQVAYARPRNSVLPPAASLLDAIKQQQPNRQTLLNWLDMEISFGEMLDINAINNEWRIHYSTLPYKQNTIAQLFV